jgi:hypothetical protein
MIRTVVAVMAPLLAAGPNALTQSPTARSVAPALCVALTVVDFEVVMVRVCVLGGVGVFAFEPDVGVPLVNWPGFRLKPETVSVDPLTDFTLPDAMAIEASSLPKLGGPFPVPPRENEPPPSAFDPPKPGRPPLPRNWKPPGLPPAAAPSAPEPSRVRKPAHDPFEVALETVMERAAMVVLDFFDCVPVTVTHSPANALMAWLTVLENFVVEVQLTVVWPELAFCTSMLELEAFSAATLPLAPPNPPLGRGVVVAAPAVELRAAAATRAVVPVPTMRAQRRRPGTGLCVDFMFVVPLSVFVFPCS